MNALKVIQPGQMELVDIAMPKKLAPYQVLVKVCAAGICGSDIHVWHGKNPYAQYPVIPGHEFSGVVEETGSGVTKFKPGDRVVVEPIRTCGKCYACRAGRPNVCSYLQVSGVHVDGGFAEYTVADQQMLHKIPDCVSLKQAAMIEPLTIGAQALLRTQAQPGDTCLIHGAGPIGLVTLILANKLGLRCMVSEPSAARRSVAHGFGAELVVDPTRTMLHKAVMNFTAGEGVNIVFDAVGILTIAENSLSLLSPAGRFLEFGYGFGSAKLDFAQINRKELTVLGSRLQTYRFQPVIELLPQILPQIDRMQTHSFRLEEYQEAFSVFTDKDSGACKVTFEF